MSPDLTTRLVCSGCGSSPAADEPYPFRCPAARDGDDVDHVLRREMSCDSAQSHAWRRIFLDGEPNPFVRYRALFHSYRVAIARSMTDESFVALVRELDERVAEVWGSGFVETPFAASPALNAAIGRTGGTLLVKDETGNVSGSHKARHMMGLAIWLEVARRTGLIARGAPIPRLAIASCGNAALAAAVVARAAGLALDVFIPPDAHPSVTRQLAELGASLNVCEREGDAPGDPCVLRFREGVAAGALPFSVQGNENGLAVEGGLTLGYEMVSALLRDGGSIDRIVVQVGGGALASSVAQALRDARNLGLLAALPRLHPVQTEGAYPLRRAWERVVAQILGERMAFRIDRREPAADAARAAAAQSAAMAPRRRNALIHAATHRAQFMTPWESVPQSVAHGILDDETYDWLAIVEATVETGGWPVVASEDELHEANAVASATTSIPADHTGTSGLAGLLQLARHRALASDETVAALFTGRLR